MKNLQFYTITTACLAIFLITALIWFGLFCQYSPNAALNVLTLGLASAILFHSRSHGLERYGKRHVAWLDLSLIAVNLVAVTANSFQGYPISLGTDYNFSSMLFFLVISMVIISLLNYGTGNPVKE